MLFLQKYKKKQKKVEQCDTISFIIYFLELFLFEKKRKIV